jgi:ATP-dependent RNA helicase DeaD
VLDHIRRRTLRLVHTHIAVLDEADEMLSMGFWDEVTAILDQLPARRQTFLFSATLPDEIRKTAQAYMHDPQNIDISRDELTVEGIENIAYEWDDRWPKPRNLLYILEVERPENAIIFCNTRDDTSVLAAFLRRQGLHAMALSGELAQRDRERIMRRMKAGELQYLVATDIAARGIDISDLSHVILYSLPEFTEVYLHRVGRTGRIGKKGTAISLVTGKDEITFTQLRRQYGIMFQKRTLPPLEEIERLQAERVAGELMKEAREVEITAFLPLAEALRTREGGTEAIAFLLKRHFSILEDERKREPVELGEPEEKKKKKKKKRWEEEEEEELSDQTAPEPASTGEEEPGDKKKRRRRRKKRHEGVSEEMPRADNDAVRLFVNRGSTDGYGEHEIRRLVLEAAASEELEAVLGVQLRRTHSFVDARPALAEAAVQGAQRGIEREEKPVAIERARTRG